jgi:AraC family transcriptional regulator
MPVKSSSPRLTAVLVAIQSELNKRVDLASMARRARLSQFHFHRLFKELIGETPRQHIERLRLERAFFRLAITDEEIHSIAEDLGFRNHETFSRSFRRRFGKIPSRLRKDARSSQKELARTGDPRLRTDCQLSNVRFETLRPALLLAHRRIGDYASFEYAPFMTGDRLWNPLVRYAMRHGVQHASVAWGLSHDLPGITPPDAQRYDGCIRVDRLLPSLRNMHSFRFDGGMYGVIEHIGAPHSIASAYLRLAAAIRTSRRFDFREGAAVTIYKAVHIDGDPQLNHTSVCWPVGKRKLSKKRQSHDASAR